jgi:hypothetical protein
MRTAAQFAWRGAAVLAFGATAALAVVLSRPAPAHVVMTTASQASPVPRCGGTRLAVSLGTTRRQPHAATAYQVEFTNASHTACTLAGYPHVAAYDTRGGRYTMIGNAAPRAALVAGPVVLRPGATAHADVDLTAVSLLPKGCRKVTAAGLRVVVPGESAPRYLRHQVTACSASGPKAPEYLRVGAVQPGTSRA